MKEGLSRPMVRGGAVLFALFVVSTVVAIIYLLSQPISVSERFAPKLSEVMPLLRVATVLLAGICVSSFVLALHFRRLGAYSKAQEIFFSICFGLSLCLGLLVGIPVVATLFV